jgi:hypothetical protein
MWDRYPAIGDWWARMRERPSVKATVIDRMTDIDWAPFRNLARSLAQSAIAHEGGVIV